MSTPLAMAAVTAVLKTVINEALTAGQVAGIVGGMVPVTALPPDRVLPESGPDPNQVNIFLYQTSVNTGWRNIDLPTRDSSGNLRTAPLLAINLHYLLSTYGAQDFFSEILLGYAMQALHENATIPRDAIRLALTPATPVPGQPKELADSLLADQAELIKIAPEVLNPEEMSRLWTAMQTRYRSSAAYQVTVVLIDSVLSASAALPVMSSSSTSVALPQIVLAAAVPDTGTGTPLFATNKLVLTGTGLKSADSRVQIGNVEIIPASGAVAQTQITVDLSTAPAGLYAGVLSVQVVQYLQLGNPSTAHSIYRSNALSVTLRPAIVATVPTLTKTVVGGVSYSAGTIQVNFTPSVARTQQVSLLLNQLNPAIGTAPMNYTFTAPAFNGITDPTVADTASIVFTYSQVVSGTYLIRVQVDGAESVLGVTSGVYATPTVTLV